MNRWHIKRLLRRYKRDLSHLETLWEKKNHHLSPDELSSAMSNATPQDKIHFFDHHLIKEETKLLSDLLVHAQLTLDDKEVYDVVMRLGYDPEKINVRLRNAVAWFDKFNNEAILHESLLNDQIKGKEVDIDKINKLEKHLIFRYEKYKGLVMASLERIMHDVENSNNYQASKPSLFGKYTSKVAAASRAMAASFALSLALGFGGQMISAEKIYAQEVAMVTKKEQTDSGKDKPKKEKTIEEKIKELEEQVKNKPTVDLNLQLSSLYYSQGKFDKCDFYAREVLKLDPKNSMAYNNMGDVAFNAKHLQDAENNYKNSIRLNSDNIKPYIGLSVLLIKESRLAEASNLLTTAKKISPGNGYIWTYSGELNLKQGQYVIAETELKKATGLLPSSPTPYTKLATLYNKTNKPEKGLQIVQEGLNSFDSNRSLLSWQKYFKKKLNK